jgi:hypothetical protein
MKTNNDILYILKFKCNNEIFEQAFSEEFPFIVLSNGIVFVPPELYKYYKDWYIDRNIIPQLKDRIKEFLHVDKVELISNYEKFKELLEQYGKQYGIYLFNLYSDFVELIYSPNDKENNCNGNFEIIEFKKIENS